ncbi:caspase-7-like isoform X2 [Cylas formicarius]|uniref:caspase-7-like isoform X2 n=1 Tax=Cylas formicarius TaxID=197179 RepID=UPI002958661E|nr:caspase-7-like isoform X2 [Cylas formicarius]
MFSGKNKKKEKSGNSSSVYAEKTSVKKGNDGVTTTIFHRSSSQIFSSTVKEERSVSFSRGVTDLAELTSKLNLEYKPIASSSAFGASSSRYPYLTNNNILQPTQIDAKAFTHRPLPLSQGSNTFPTNTTYRTAFGGTTTATYPSRHSTSPYISAQNAPVSTHAQSQPNIVSSLIPAYPNSCPKRGRALIINNIKFGGKTNEQRKGAEKDHEDLQKLFRALNFDVVAHKNLKSHEMMKAIKNFRALSFKKYDMSVVVMMSHGTNKDSKGNSISGGYTEIFGVDDVGLPIDSVLDEFSIQNSKQLLGKPKIFIIQCCRGSLDESSITVDAAPIRKVVKAHADMLIAFSTLPGFVSNRDPVKGTWYIQSICDIFYRYHKTFHVEEMLKLVDVELSKKHPDYTQTSTYESRGFKKCYLHPRDQ